MLTEFVRELTKINYPRSLLKSILQSQKTKTMNKNNKKIYLAVPYSDKNPKIMEQRFKKVNKASVKLLKLGYHVFSPISMNHCWAKAGKLPGDWEFWKNYDVDFLQICAKLFVLKLKNWEKSIGVNAEIQLAKKLKIPIEYLEASFAK